MMRNAILIGILLGASASFPLLYRTDPRLLEAVLARSDDPIQSATITAVGAVREPQANAGGASTSGRRVHIDVDQSGHFYGEFRLNGRRVQALIDTGASALAINLSTARRIGIAVSTADLTHTVNTANGKARATMVTVDRVEIGRIAVTAVQAIVLDDRSLSGTLVGMTFLNRLKGFRVENDAMVLAQ